MCEIAQQVSVVGNHPNQCHSQRKTFWNQSPVHLHFCTGNVLLTFLFTHYDPFRTPYFSNDSHRLVSMDVCFCVCFFSFFSFLFFFFFVFFFLVFLCRIVSVLLNLRWDSPVKEKSKPTFLVKTKEEAPPCTIKIKSTACQSTPNGPCPI